MTLAEFQADIRAGIPDRLPAAKPYDKQINHAPKRKDILTPAEKELALRNALRYFPAKHHAVLAREFAAELRKYGRIYMYRLRPDYEMYARPIDEYPARCRQAAAIMMMIQNNLDKAVAQHPHELITYGGNGAVFQNWAQYRLTMKYLSEMTDRQTLVMYSGHPLGLFPSHPDAPRVVVTNGMVIPNYSKPDDWERMNALGVSQYGQMTAGSYMYIGPQGIVHGTTITVMNAARKRFTADRRDARGMLFVSSGLGGMSGAQPKAGNISGVVSVIAEINPKAARKRYEQGWVDELHESLDELIERIRKAVSAKEIVSLAYVGNVVDLWERLAAEEIPVDLGSDQTSLHNPWAGGYYPVGLSYEASNKMMAEEPTRFRECVQESLRRQVDAINKLTSRGMYFFDYGNAFLLEASRAGACSYKGLSVADVDPDILHAFLRLVELLEKPEQIPILGPLIVREIHYRLLIGPQGEFLRRLNTLGTQSNQIAQAITWLRDNYREPLQVDKLAQKVNMATSTFHRHFKEVTTLSPLQFHKRLRLYEAKRLMLTESKDASSASLAVGYESPTQFNREYKRLFGEPPHRDVMRMR